MFGCSLGPVFHFGRHDLLFPFDKWPAKDACQVRYLVSADMSLPTGVLTRGNRCFHLEGFVLKPTWGLSKAVPVLFLILSFSMFNPLFN